MTPTVNALWTTLKCEVEKIQKKVPGIRLEENKEKEFKTKMMSLYDEIKTEYMHKDVKFLDRHKVAAIAIVSIVQCDLITYDGDLKNNQVFLGKELIAITVALAMMLKMLNEKIKKNGINGEIRAYYMPKAMSCKTPYFLILARNLYFSQKKYGLNPLELAEKLFLLETITLEKNGIDPVLLSEY